MSPGPRDSDNSYKYHTSQSINVTDITQSDTNTETRPSGTDAVDDTDTRRTNLQIGRRNLLKTGSMLPLFGALSTVPEVGAATDEEGGPVVLMGLDSELDPGVPDHGPPQEHAAMVQSILDDVRREGDGILVIGANGSDAEAYWEDDVGANVGEDVTIVTGAADIQDVEFDGYAMVGIASSEFELSGSGLGLTNDENAALIDRASDLAAFVNNGGGLLGKTQTGLDDPWVYADPLRVFETRTGLGYSTIDMTDDGRDLGLTQGGMSGWCCWHDTFTEFPDVYNVLVVNDDGGQGDGEPAAIGGAKVVLIADVDVRIVGPDEVPRDETEQFDLRLRNAGDTTEQNVDVTHTITRQNGDISGSDFELEYFNEAANEWQDVLLDEENGAFVGSVLPDDGIAMPEQLDDTRELRASFDIFDRFQIETEAVGVDDGEVYDTSTKTISVGEGSLSVSIQSTNAPIAAGEELSVTVEIANADEETGIATVSLDTDGLADFDPGTTIRFDNEGEVDTHTFDVETEIGDEDSYTLVVEADGPPGDGSDSETIEIKDGNVVDATVEVSRSTTNVLSPTTLQVTDPTDETYTYEWEIVDKPLGTNPGLLHEENINTALHPKQVGEYIVEVTVKDDETTVATATKDIEATETLVNGEVDDGTTVQELVEKYAPRYYFTDGEEYFPTRYEAYVENAELRIDGLIGEETIAEDISLLDLGNPELLDVDDGVYTPSNSDNRLFLKGDEEDFKDYQSQYPETIHANVVPSTPSPVEDDDGGPYTAITYWAFYLFDPKKEGDIEEDAKAYVFAHVSDTETLTILVNEEGPQWVGAAQHYSGEYMKWEKATGSSALTTPEIYPSQGAHSTFLVNTGSYVSGIPAQARWLRGYIDSTRTIAGWSGPGDITGQGVRWEYSDPDNVAVEYDLVILPDKEGDGQGAFDEEGWAEFAGIFTADTYRVWDQDGGKMPQAREDRWSDPGEWIPNRMLPEHAVLDDDIISTDLGRFTVDTVIGEPSAFKIENFNNPGKKPHDFWAEAIITPENGEVKQDLISIPLAWNARMETITIPLEKYDLPDEGKLTVEVIVRTYQPEIADDEDDIIVERSGTTNLGDIGDAVDDAIDVITDPIPGLSIQGPTVISPGEEADSTITVTNNSTDQQSFFVTLSAIGPEGEQYQEHTDGKEVQLDPEESRDISLFWEVNNDVPEGEYDLLTQVWLETDPQELATELLSATDENAFIVEKPTGNLTVTSTPSDVPIAADGEFLGRSPVSTSLPVGTYKIVGTSDEAGDAEETVEITETGATVSLNLTTGESPLEPYTDSDGVVSTTGLRQAIDDWRGDDLNTDLLRQTIDAWRKSDPVI